MGGRHSIFHRAAYAAAMSKVCKEPSAAATMAWLLVMRQRYSLQAAATLLGTTPRRVEHLLAGLMQRRARLWRTA
jgi:hypothetical protein